MRSLYTAKNHTHKPTVNTNTSTIHACTHARHTHARIHTPMSTRSRNTGVKTVD